MICAVNEKERGIDLRLSVRFLGCLHNSDNGAPDWAIRLNSYQASNWLYGVHPRVSNSHWLLSPIMTTIESGNLPDRPFFMSIQKRGAAFIVLHGLCCKWKKERGIDYVYLIDSSDVFIIVIMGHRIEPMSQSLPSFKLTLGNEFLESVIHVGCYPPLWLL